MIPLEKPNGTTHAYGYDALGRLTNDAVEVLGTGVDGAIRRLTIEYDSQGNAYRFTSHDAASGGSIVNQVQRAFNGLGQLTTEYQAVDGSVNTATTPKVEYSYSEMAGGANHSRATSMIYPDGRELFYSYGSGIDGDISRLTSLSDTSGTLEGLTYLGLGTVVQRSHPESGIDLTYIGSTAGAGGDIYTGLDRFGRIVDQNWTDGTTSVDHFAYGYDRNSNRLFKENLLSAGNSKLYAYDDLNRLTNMQRGMLNGAKDAITGTPGRTQGWELDALGNSESVTTDSVTQTREHNAQNQLTNMGSSTLTFDNNGNQTTDQTGKTLIYDAWNRLVEAKDESTTLIRYEHDALTRRIQEGTTVVYHTSGWQAIEERNGSGQVTQQYVYSPVYIDALIARDRDTNADGTTDERLYVMQDANFNVAAIASSNGNVLQRFQYDAYGARTVFDASWTAAADAYSFQYGHQGGKIDAVTDYIHFRYRELNTAQMRWMQEDPIGYADTMNVYRAIGSNPLIDQDPYGLMPNQRDAITLDQLIAKVEALEAQNRGKSPKQMLLVARNHAKEDSADWWKYLHITPQGQSTWIDIPHFLESAAGSQSGSSLMTWVLGLATEVVQSFRDPRTATGSAASAWGPEDITSNNLGNVFGGGLACEPALSVQLRMFLEKKGPTNPEAAPNWYALPPTEAQWQNEFREHRTMADYRKQHYLNPSPNTWDPDSVMSHPEPVLTGPIRPRSVLPLGSHAGGVWSGLNSGE